MQTRGGGVYHFYEALERVGSILCAHCVYSRAIYKKESTFFVFERSLKMSKILLQPKFKVKVLVT